MVVMSRWHRRSRPLVVACRCLKTRTEGDSTNRGVTRRNEEMEKWERKRRRKREREGRRWWSPVVVSDRGGVEEKANSTNGYLEYLAKSTKEYLA
ncbi:uncharacterized protein DS421_4g113300 [Arachis hypogaea]|nr:uncharacterized protein DS421_4g113300 [Arachis hypogaea]